MNREIKFRGKRIDNGEWVIGDLCCLFNRSNLCIMPDSFYATRHYGDDTETDDPIIEDSMAVGGFFSVVPESVGQYTGLKDKNGKEIYQGDVVNLHVFTQELCSNLGVTEGEKEFKGIIRMEEYGWALHEENSNKWPLQEDWFYLVYAPGMLHEESFEVIGNIYENPELLNS